MRRNSTATFGALHPALFFLFIYGLSLFMAIFICRTVYNSLNGAPETALSSTLQSDAAHATAMR